MDARQRVALAFDHKEPDRVPIDYWATPTVTARLLDHFGLATEEELLEHLDVDFRYVDGPKYVGPEPAVHADGSVEDHWGVPRVRVKLGSGGEESVYQEVLHFPLKEARSVAEIRDYPRWPSPDWFDYGCVAGQVAEARRTGKVVVFMGDRMNRCAQLKPAMYLRGIDQILLDLALEPEIAEYLFGRISEFYLEYLRRTLEAGGGQIDVVMMGDDFGTQKGLFMSPAMWRRFVRPGFKAFIDLARRHGCKVAHHSCGSIQPILPDLIECGLDILNPVQPDVVDMDRRELKVRYGDRLSFHGSISIQRTLPFGTPDDVRNEVRERMETLASGGGFIFCTAHNIQADTPTENIVALFEAYRELGRYGRRASG
ncbi:MAG: uroporphyrinogen decarboxylase family protein [Thermoguttaceae bacterium]